MRELPLLKAKRKICFCIKRDKKIRKSIPTAEIKTKFCRKKKFDKEDLNKAIVGRKKMREGFAQERNIRVILGVTLGEK